MIDFDRIKFGDLHLWIRKQVDSVNFNRIYIRSKSDRKFGDAPYNVSFTYVIVWLISILELHNMFKKFFEFCWHVFQKLLVFISFLELTNFFLLKKKTIRLVINNLSRVITFCGIFLSISYWALFSKYFLAYIKEWNVGGWKEFGK